MTWGRPASRRPAETSNPHFGKRRVWPRDLNPGRSEAPRVWRKSPLDDRRFEDEVTGCSFPRDRHLPWSLHRSGQDQLGSESRRDFPRGEIDPQVVQRACDPRKLPGSRAGLRFETASFGRGSRPRSVNARSGPATSKAIRVPGAATVGNVSVFLPPAVTIRI